MNRWVLLIHQIPPKPDYLRVKVRRSLERFGALALKNSVYVLPEGDRNQGQFRSLCRAIEADGGHALVCEATFVEGISDADIVATFRERRDACYRDLAHAALATRAAQATARTSRSVSDGGPESAARGALQRLKRRMGQLRAIDFFDAPGRGQAEAAIAEVERRVETAGSASLPLVLGAPAGSYHGRTWVTRSGVFVDRIASAWLIRRFIDPEARFRFVEPATRRVAPGELRFDMAAGEFTHEGDRCTFETLLTRFDLHDPALIAMSEVVHDLDLRDGRFGRDETAGIGALLEGIALAHEDDAIRIERGSAAFDDLLVMFQRKQQPMPGT
ncbi:MAG: chromate resistance protein ChrB domain-containing protein [Gemmatimonadaceae bacterium]